MITIITIGSFTTEIIGGTGTTSTSDIPDTVIFIIASTFLIIGYILDRWFPFDQESK